jgi:hypothetical protein
MIQPAPALDNEQAIQPAAATTLAFLRSTSATYQENLGLFVRILSPAVLLGYIAVFVTSAKSQEMIRELVATQRLDDYGTLVAAGMVRQGGMFVSWLLYSFAFVATCAAVRTLNAGETPSADAAYAQARERIGAMLLIAILLFLLAIFAAVVAIFVGNFFPRIRALNASNWIFYTIMVLGWTGVAKLSLAFPAAVLDRVSLKQAFFLSDELTAGRNLILFVLLLETLGGSYLAHQIPYVMSEWIWGTGIWPDWVSYATLACAILGGALVQPNLFVSLARLYEDRRIER